MSTLVSSRNTLPTPKPSDKNEMHILLTGNTTFKLINFRQGLIKEMLAKGHRVTVLSPPDEYVPDVKALGCDHVALKMDRNGMSIIAEIALLLRVIWKFQIIRPHTVFSYTIKNNIYSGLACRMLGIPFVPNVTGLGPAFNKRGMLNIIVRLLYKSAFKRARLVFFQNDNDLALFTHAGLCKSHIAKLLPGSGVDLNKFAAHPLPKAQDGSVCFLLVARMLWDKGVGEFAEAARIVKQHYPKTQFKLLGPLDPGSQSGIAKKNIDAWVAEGAVDYLGSTRDVSPFLEAAHCVVLPSYYHEGTPRALLEACAVGRPIITTDMPGCRDVVKHGINGFLVSKKNTTALARALIKIAECTPARLSQMGFESRLIAEQRFNEQYVINEYINILDF